MLSVLMTYIRAHLPKGERGQDLIEYALLGGLIALAIMGAALFLQPGISALGTGISSCVDFTAGGCDPW